MSMLGLSEAEMKILRNQSAIMSSLSFLIAIDSRIVPSVKKEATDILNELVLDTNETLGIPRPPKPNYSTEKIKEFLSNGSD